MGRPDDLLLVFADALTRSWKQIIKFKPEAAADAAAAGAPGAGAPARFAPHPTAPEEIRFVARSRTMRRSKRRGSCAMSAVFASSAKRRIEGRS